MTWPAGMDPGGLEPPPSASLREAPLHAKIWERRPYKDGALTA